MNARKAYCKLLTRRRFDQWLATMFPKWSSCLVRDRDGRQLKAVIADYDQLIATAATWYDLRRKILYRVAMAVKVAAEEQARAEEEE